MTERVRYWCVVDQDGVNFVTTKGRMRPRRAAGFPMPVQVDRLPETFETRVRGRWVRDHDSAIDAEHRARNGADAIARAHAVKVVEAGLMIAGVMVDGLIAAEAKAIGVEPIELARTVAAKTAPLIEAEVARRAAKMRHRGKGSRKT